MKHRRFNWFLLLRLAGIVLFIVVLSRADLGELWLWIRQVDRSYFILALLFQLMVLVVKAWRWYILNEEGFNTSILLRRSGEFFEGYAIGVITPGRVGELMKAGHAGSRKGILGAGLKVIAERGMDLSIFIIVGGLAISQDVLPGISSGWGWFIFSDGLAGMIFSMLLLLSPGLVKQAENLMKWIRLLGQETPLDYQPRKLPNVAAFLGWSLISNLSYFTCCYFLALGIGMEMSLIGISGGVATAGVVNTIPVTVMGLGTREVTFLYVFRAFPQAQVLAFSGLVFLVAQIGGGLISLVLGQILLWKFRGNRKHTYKQTNN
jgi:glycosyltransferase 2 family protein